MTSPLALSVLDLVPVRADQTTSDAVQASIALAKLADELGFTRYWVAEHHNMASVAATNPPVMIAMLGAATSRIRVGSGGVMLPNHAPFVIAEQLHENGVEARLVVEPARRDTAPALTLAASLACANGDDAILIVMPADHAIADLEALQSAL